MKKSCFRRKKGKKKMPVEFNSKFEKAFKKKENTEAI